MDTVKKLTTFLLAIIPVLTVAMAVNPGVQMRMTQRGLAYANSVAQAVIKAELQKLSIPDQSGDEHRLSWSLKNIQAQSITGPSSQMTFTPEHNGLTWALSDFGIDLRADWHAKYKQGWVKISDGGSVTVRISRISLTVMAGFDQKDGRPSISSRSCAANVGDVSVDFHGGTAIIWNLFKGIVEDKIRDLLRNRICEVINNKIDKDADEELSKMKVHIEFDNRFILDYALVSAPAITSLYLDTFNKGEVYWKADRQECPFSPGLIPPWSETNSMLYVWLTEYTASSFLYAAHNHGYLKYNVTKDDLAKNYVDYLNTTCSSQCIGSLIKEIADQFPNSWVELRMNSTAMPVVKITSENITASICADVELVAHAPDGTVHYLLTLNVSLSMTIEASVEDEKLVAIIIGHSFDTDVIKSAIGNINVKRLRLFIEGVLTFAVIPKLNKLGKAGIELPVSRDVQFVNTKLIMLDGVLLVSTDVQYKNSLKFVPEMHH